MSSRSNAIQVKKVVKSTVDQVVGESEANDEAQAELNGPAEADESEVRRSVRSRKEPDRLDTNKMLAAKQKETRKRAAPFKYEVEMTPPPANLRGILKKVPKPFPPPRKSSLSAVAGKSIAKKYRKVRVSRVLKVKVIPPLPGWREGIVRMGDAEEEAEQEQEKEAQKKKKRKRKSGGLPTVSSVSECDETIAPEEEKDPAVPGSPDVFYDEYMRACSPDSVLVTDSETEETRRPASKSLFAATIDGTTGEDTVAGDTVAGDTVAKDPEPPKTKERRRSHRPDYKEPAEDTDDELIPLKWQFLASPDQDWSPRRGARRRGRVVAKTTATLADADDPMTSSTSSATRRKSARGTVSRESQLSLPSDSNSTKRLVEAKSEQAKRKGQRSRKFESEDVPSKSSSSKSSGEEKKKEKEKPQAHPFFAKFAPKPAGAATVVPTVPATVEQKQQKARRRSTFVPKKPVADKKEGKEGRERAKEKDKEESEGEEAAIEIVAEVKRQEKKVAAPSQSAAGRTPPTSIWRSTEIDAAPYAGLVHVGRDEEEEMEDDGELVKKIRRMSVEQPAIRFAGNRRNAQSK